MFEGIREILLGDGGPKEFSWFLAVYAFVIGSIFGSFANVIAWRMPQGLSIIYPRSRCPKCSSFICWWNNIPIFSWFFLKGRCRSCSEKISFRYPVVEFITALLFLLIYLRLGVSWSLLEYWYFAFALVAASVIDLDHMILPDKITLSGIVIGLVGASLNPEREFLSAFLGVFLGGGFLWAVAYIYLILRKQEGMGGG